MKQKKNLEYFFKKFQIPFEKITNGYYLWGDKEFVYSNRDCWGIVNCRRHSSRRWKRYLKENSNGKERSQLRENLHHERFNDAETRQNKDNPWNWD